MADSYQIKDQGGTYFITCQVIGWVDVFSRQTYRDIIISSLKYCMAEKNLIVYAYVIMTNHVHLILRSKSERLSDTVRDFKRFTSNQILKSIDENHSESRKDWMNIVFEYHARFNKRVKDKQFWTHENHAVELNNNEVMDSKLNYIHENPVRAGWVERAEDYLYSSARNYAGLYNLLEIEMI
ncbi:transposase [Ekhidna sp.]|jgi:REP element-mobilizing transposase RayT|uniref:REP-associated tyrosine transposase n=1 Tax=Ekhidna sp. TaxID=2608089 RepID=UPI0032ED1E4C